MNIITKEFLWSAGNVLGRIVKIDFNTLGCSDGFSKVERGRFARIVIEVYMKKKLVAKLRAGRRVYGVEYEGLGLTCFDCGMYGHRRDSCPKKSEEC